MKNKDGTENTKKMEEMSLEELRSLDTDSMTVMEVVHRCYLIENIRKKKEKEFIDAVSY